MCESLYDKLAPEVLHLAQSTVLRSCEF